MFELFYNNSHFCPGVILHPINIISIYYPNWLGISVCQYWVLPVFSFLYSSKVVYIIFSLNRQGGLSSLYTQQIYLYSQFPPSLSLYLTQSTCLQPHPRAPTCIPRVLFQKLSFFIFFSRWICLFELGLSCGTWDLHCITWHVGYSLCRVESVLTAYWL